MTDDTHGHDAEYDFKYSKTAMAIRLVAAILLGAVLALLALQFPEVTGWTIERASTGDLPPI